TLEDIVFVKLQKYTWNILYLQPWVYPSLPAAEWENLQNLFRAYVQDFNLYLSNDARLYQTSSPHTLWPTSAPPGLPPPLGSRPPEPPVATVFARTPRPDQLLLVCRVTGFYPRPISVAWLRDGQEVPPGPALNTSTILPNADLTYQLRSVLAVASHDGHSYACRVPHRSLGTHSLLIPWGSSKAALSVGITIAVLLIVAAALAGAIWRYRRM
ncbi:PREDICTED: T-cell surface glycoprotein CD1b-2, partial [Aptenodytes forsteri]|uniref:T-cell surface glycoprotein CD1b-2 n=1 Tax=Aptenodytes forsteri TaxID=9233 RepID=UPI0009055D7A